MRKILVLAAAGAALLMSACNTIETLRRTAPAVVPKRWRNRRENAQRFSKPLAMAISEIASGLECNSRRARSRR